MHSEMFGTRVKHATRVWALLLWAGLAAAAAASCSRLGPIKIILHELLCKLEQLRLAVFTYMYLVTVHQSCLAVIIHAAHHCAPQQRTSIIRQLSQPPLHPCINSFVELPDIDRNLTHCA